MTRFRLWFAVPVVVLVIVASAVAVRFVYLRSAVRTELGSDLDGPLYVAQTEINLWREHLAVRVRLAASLLSAESRTRPLSDSAFDRIAQAVSIPDSAMLWLASASGLMLHQRGSQSAPPGDLRAGFTTSRCGQKFCAEMRQPLTIGASDSAMIAIRLPITNSTLRYLESPVRKQGARLTVLMRDRDSLFILAVSGRDTVTNRAMAFSWTDAPEYVRQAFSKPRTAGTASLGLVGQRVVFATVLDSPTGWVLLREIDGDVFVERLLTPIGIDVLVVAALLLFALAYLASRARIAEMRREQEVAAVRADFVAAVSHELRTPLAQIKLFAELLRKKALRRPGEIERAHHVIEKEAGRLGILVDNVLSHARLTRRSSTPPEVDTGHATDVARDVAYVVDAFAPLAAEKGARVVSSVSGTAMAPVDSQSLRQILLNFLENAVRYGPRGQTITLACEQSADAIRLSVSDEGQGVAEAERDAIWLPFERGAAGRASTGGGSGIGLSVVRNLVGQYGGKAWVESTPTGGARFVVEFARVEEADALRHVHAG